MKDQEPPLTVKYREPIVPYIEVASKRYMKRTLCNIIKTFLWNLILPPHVRLHLPKDEGR